MSTIDYNLNTLLKFSTCTLALKRQATPHVPHDSNTLAGLAVAAAITQQLGATELATSIREHASGLQRRMHPDLQPCLAKSSSSSFAARGGSTGGLVRIRARLKLQLIGLHWSQYVE